MKKKRNFYVLQQPFSDVDYSTYGNIKWSTQYKDATWADEVELETIKCSVHPGHQRAAPRSGKLSICLPSDEIGDFVWTWYSDCLVTKKVVEVFREADATGYSFKPVTIKPTLLDGKTLMEIPNLWELVVTGKGGDADPKSGIELIYTCEYCNLKVFSSYKNGIIVNEQNWDGSDFFTINGYRLYRLVTEKVKNNIVSERLTNCLLLPSEKLEWKSLTRPEGLY